MWFCVIDVTASLLCNQVSSFTVKCEIMKLVSLCPTLMSFFAVFSCMACHWWLLPQLETCSCKMHVYKCKLVFVAANLYYAETNILQMQVLNCGSDS